MNAKEAIAIAKAAHANCFRPYLSGVNLSRADLSGANLRGCGILSIPAIENIDAAILAAIKRGGKLQMSAYHSCETTHCRAGWAIVLAGEEGLKLEEKVGSCAAGALIYAKSRPDKRVPNFFATNVEAMADLKACAGVA